MNEQHMPPSPEAIALGYEPRDVNSWSLVRFAVLLAMVIGLVCAFLLWLFGFYQDEARQRDPQISPLATSQAPPEPRLQENPANDLGRMRAAEDKALGEYLLIDKQQGTVRIPIDRAMDVLLKRGLPDIKERPAADNRAGREEPADADANQHGQRPDDAEPGDAPRSDRRRSEPERQR